MKRITPFVPPATLHCIFNALVQPYFNYCLVVWGYCCKTLSDRLRKLQNRVACIVSFSSYDADAWCLLQRLGFWSLSVKMVSKTLNSLAPEYLFSVFTESINLGYALRDSANIWAVPSPRTNYLINSSTYRGATLWNSPPLDLRQKKSFNNNC